MPPAPTPPSPKPLSGVHRPATALWIRAETTMPGDWQSCWLWHPPSCDGLWLERRTVSHCPGWKTFWGHGAFAATTTEVTGTLGRISHPACAKAGRFSVLWGRHSLALWGQQGGVRPQCFREQRTHRHQVVFFLGGGLFVFSGPHPQHMEIPRLGVQSELPAYTTAPARAMPDPSRVCNLHHSSWQRQILNPLSEAMGQTCVLMNTSQIYF